MLSPKIGTIASLIAVCACAHADESTMSSLKKFAAQYSNGVVQKDLKTIVALMHPEFRAHIGGVEKATAFYRDAPPGAWPVSEKLGTTELCSVGGLEVALMKSSRTLKFLQGPVEVEHTYVFVSPDKGKSWSVVDQGCTTRGTLMRVSPALADDSCGKKMLAHFFPD